MQCKHEGNEYKVTRGTRIFLFLSALLLLAFGIFLIILPFMEQREGIGTYIFLIVLGFFIILISILGFLDLLKAKLILFQDKLIIIGFKKKKEMYINDIEGYRVLENGMIVIVPKNKDLKEIKFINIFEKKEEIAEWFDKNLQNLSLEAYQAEEKEILNNDQISLYEEERKQKLEQARKIAKWGGYAVLLLAFWAFIHPYPYKIMCLVFALCPWIGILLLQKYKGIIVLDSDRQSARPNVAIFFFVPAGVLAVRAMLDWNILTYENLWIPVIAVTIVTFTVLLNVIKEQKKKWGVVIILFLFLGAYGYGVTICANGLLDTSMPEKYEAVILKKYKSSGKSKSYKFKLTPWGPCMEENTADVSSNIYSMHEVGDTVSVYLFKGALSIPWFIVK